MIGYYYLPPLGKEHGETAELNVMPHPAKKSKGKLAGPNSRNNTTPPGFIHTKPNILKNIPHKSFTSGTHNDYLMKLATSYEAGQSISQ